jgi:hypothetical protein
VGEGVMEDLGRNVLGLAAIGGAAGDEGVHPVEVALVELGEAARVGLGRLDEEPLLVAAQGDRRLRCPWRHGLIRYNGGRGGNVTRWARGVPAIVGFAL